MAHGQRGVGAGLERLARGYLERQGHGGATTGIGRGAPPRRRGVGGRLARLALVLGVVLVPLLVVLVVAIIAAVLWALGNLDVLTRFISDIAGLVQQIGQIGNATGGGEG